jgi:hypothetical protein
MCECRRVKSEDPLEEEGPYLAVDLLAQRGDLLLEMPLNPMAFTSSSTERVEMPCT